MRGNFSALVRLRRGVQRSACELACLTGGAPCSVLRGSCSARAPQDEVGGLEAVFERRLRSDERSGYVSIFR